MIAQVQEKSAIVADPKAIHDAGYRDALIGKFNSQFESDRSYLKGHQTGYKVKCRQARASRKPRLSNLPVTPVFLGCTDGADDLFSLMF